MPRRGLLGCGVYLLGVTVVVDTRCGTVGDTDHRREVQGPEQSSVVASGSSEVAADATGIAGYGGETGDGGELVRAGEGAHVAAGGCIW